MNTPENDRHYHPSLFKLVEKDEIFTITPDGFETKRKIIPPFGEIQLAGIRMSEGGTREYTATGVTMKNGNVLYDDAERMEREDINLHTLLIDIYPGSKAVKGYQWVCTIFIGETGLAYQTTIMSHQTDTEELREFSVSETYPDWHSVKKDDTSLYEIMVSPQDTEFLSQLSFSISLQQASS